MECLGDLILELYLNSFYGVSFILISENVSKMTGKIAF